MLRVFDRREHHEGEAFALAGVLSRHCTVTTTPKRIIAYRCNASIGPYQTDMMDEEDKEGKGRREGKTIAWSVLDAQQHRRRRR